MPPKSGLEQQSFETQQQSPEGRNREKMSKELAELKKNPEVVKPLLDSGLKEALGNQKDAANHLYNGANKMLDNKDISEKDKQTLQTLVDFVKPFMDFEQMDDFDKVFKDTMIFLNVFLNPKKENIKNIQEFVYNNLEDGDAKQNLAKTSLKGNAKERDGIVGKGTTTAVLEYLDQPSETTPNTNINQKDGIGSKEVSETLKDCVTETVDNIDGAILTIKKTVENGSLQQKSIGVKIEKFANTENTWDSNISGTYENNVLKSGSITFTIKDKGSFEKMKKSFEEGKNTSPDLEGASIQIDEVNQTISLTTEKGTSLSSLESSLNTDDGELKEEIRGFVAFTNGKIQEFMPAKKSSS